MERTTKLLITWHVGKRTQYDTIQFIQGIDQAVDGRFQISTDGFGDYGYCHPSLSRQPGRLWAGDQELYDRRGR
jgi:hypothetical protein